MILLLLWSLMGVTVGPGWSYPIVVTEEPNSVQPVQFITLDSLGRFHLLWQDYKLEPRIGYKVFLLDGTTVVPDTMVSRDIHSTYLRDTHMADSLFAFWYESYPVYYCIRSLEDGSEITPATYLFTEYTELQSIRACPDSLGRLHVLRNIGQDVYYAVWTPAPGSGFIEEYGWMIPEAWIIGMLLVDGDRVHMILGDSYQTYMYMQYDLEGNVTIPLYDFTQDNWYMDRYPGLAVDNNGDLIVVSQVLISGHPGRYGFWRLDGKTGDLEIEKWIVVSDIPNMDVSTDMVLLPYPGNEKFYLVWVDGYYSEILWYIVMNNEGTLLVEPTAAYDHSDEDPEQLANVDGVVDSEGNLYVIYNQAEDEPIFGGYPTFGWFNATSLGLEEEGSSEQGTALTIIEPSCNPFCGSVEFLVTGRAVSELSVYDITGRIVAEIPVSDGVGIWDGCGYSGVKLPSGVYTVSGGEDCEPAVVTLLD
ncbi:MAG: hypothetical protein KAW14_10800 [Candidatus Aegiribacteria sp.]|nr:hypothetical protein [Candidatus Aegiribacteria sp.]